MTFLHSTVKPSRQLLWLLLGALWGLIICACASVLLQTKGSTTLSDNRMMLFEALSQLLMFLAPGLMVAHMGGDLKSAVKGSWGATCVGVAAYLLLMPCIDVLTEWNEAWPLPPNPSTEESNAMLERWLMRPSVGALVLNLLHAAFLPALCEECFFRLGLQRILCRWWKREWLAVAVTALVFSAAHGEPAGLVPRFVMGLVLGAIYLRTGSILTSISIHFVNNAIIVICYWLYTNSILSVNPNDMALHIHWAITLPLTLAGAALLAVACRHPKFANSASTTA